MYLIRSQNGLFSLTPKYVITGDVKMINFLTKLDSEKGKNHSFTCLDSKHLAEFIRSMSMFHFQ